MKRRNIFSAFFMVMLAVALQTTILRPNVWAQQSATQLQSLSADPSAYAGDVILVRGGFYVFSQGFEAIADTLARRGVRSTMFRHRQERKIVAQIIANQRKYGRKPIVLIGHSWGANTIIRVAKTLQSKNYSVQYMATFAATDPELAPSNIGKLTNYYFKTDGWGKPVLTMPGFGGQLNNVDMSNTADVHHFNVEEHPALQKQVVDNVLRIIRPGGLI